ncbi:MAG: hypothetical protein KDI83_00915 [Gammaproteobacteria bacterium]|nr:hypothetical protein [Gammaproteobacteria bacterium]
MSDIYDMVSGDWQCESCDSATRVRTANRQVATLAIPALQPVTSVAMLTGQRALPPDLVAVDAKRFE